jgi:hypothetical protein
MLGLDHHVAQPWPGRNADLGGVLALLRILRQHFFVRRQAGLGLGLAGARRGAHPLQFARQRALPG